MIHSMSPPTSSWPVEGNKTVRLCLPAVPVIHFTLPPQKSIGSSQCPLGIWNVLAEWHCIHKVDPAETRTPVQSNFFSKTVNPGALLIGWFKRSRREEAIPHVCAAPRLRMVSVVQREHFG